MGIENKIEENIVLAPFTTFKIGGAAKFFLKAKTDEELSEAVDWARKAKEDVYILGGGSNILINDAGVAGLVVKMDNSEAEVKGERLECGAGTLLSGAVILASGHDLTGLEWAIGIPGTVGGAVVGNAGAFGHSFSEAVEWVEVFNLKKKKLMKFSRNDCRFGYRESVFKEDRSLAVWKVGLKLAAATAGTKSVMEEFISRRTNSHPNLPSAGSIFKNVKFQDLAGANPEAAARAEEEGIVKNGLVAAGWLIGSLDLKGKIIGGAKVSLEHANFIVNTGKATAEDVITLISYIKQQVRDISNIQLQEEIQYLGF